MCTHLLGKEAPLFQLNAALPNLTYGSVSLGENIKNKKWTLLVFYPFDFSPDAVHMLTAFSKRKRSFLNHQAEYCFVSLDSVYTHRKFLMEEKFPIALGSDLTHQVGKDYGCHVREDGSGYRGIYIISDQGILVYAQLMLKPVAIEVQYYLDLLMQFQSHIS